MTTAISRTLPERAVDTLRRAGNPFCNYFARNPDDDVCARYHVPELYQKEREQLWALVDLYRYQPGTHSEMIPVLGNKGSGKTHLLHSIKHGGAGAWQLLVTPGTYQRDSEFLEYLLFQIIDTLLGGGKQRGVRPLQYVGQEVARRLTGKALAALTPEEKLDLFPMPLFGRWAKKLGLGASQAQERTQYLIDNLKAEPKEATRGTFIVQHLNEVSLESARACQLVCDFIQKNETHNTAGLMRRHILQGFVRGVLLGDESELASFLTYGFAELEFHVRPTRQDLVLALFKVLMGVFLELKIPVVVAFDQLEDLLLARRAGDAHQVAEAFFAGIVQGMHQIDGVCFLVFAERGLWNRFVPSLDGYIQDRLNNPVHLPGHGTVKTLKLEAPAPELVRKVVEARLRPALEELPDFADLPACFPFTEEQVERVARTEPTLRDCLQQFRHLYDRLIYGESDAETPRRGDTASRLPSDDIAVKSVIVVETPGEATSHASPDAAPTIAASSPRPRVAPADLTAFRQMWDQELEAARQQLLPDGGLTGATRELQAGLGDFLKTCHEHGVKVGPWRLQHVVPEFSFSEHPTYGVLTLAHWAIKDGQPWKVGIGLFLARSNAKPKDLEIKLGSFEVEPAVVDHLILLRPEEDLTLSGKSKTLWADAEKKGRHARLEPVSPGHVRNSLRLPPAGWPPSPIRCRKATRSPTWPTSSRSAATSCWSRSACRCRAGSNIEQTKSELSASAAVSDASQKRDGLPLTCVRISFPQKRITLLRSVANGDRAAKSGA